jgi:general secretion pathway protein A
MYLEHFNFARWPFSIAPNPRFIYLSAQHREALAHLLYGIQVGGGFVALTGEVGTGKTTLCRCLLEQLPEDVDVALIFNPRLSHRELLANVCDELHIANPGPRASNKALIDLLNHHLLQNHAKGRRTVLLIDEAQNLRRDVLEQIRLLTNLETNETKLLQIILVGQPELRDMLATSELRQLSQRITARYHLGPLSQAETRAYIEHRLSVAEGRTNLFSAAAVSRIHGLSKGIPRLINLICDRSLLGAYALGRIDVTPAVVNKAAREILAQPGSTRWQARRPLWLGLLAAGLLAAAFWLEGETRLADWVLDTLVSSSPKELAEVAATTPQKTATPASANPAVPAKANADPPAVPINDSVPPIPALVPDLPAVLVPAADTARSIETPPPPAPTSLVQALADSAPDRTPAISKLFRLWGVENWQGGDECQFARINGLRCHAFEGSWDQIKRLNHPAVLEFGLGEGRIRFATLVQIDADSALLDLNGHSLTVSLADLDVYWAGRATLLWKPPPGYSGSIEQGKKGPAVGWLRQRLGVKAKPGQEQTFDGGLLAQIAAYQQLHGLPVDGSAGPKTLLYLNAEQGDGPRLGLAKVSPQN